MKIGNVNIDGKIILAPMAGVTNLAYRRIMHDAGASLVMSEMISAKGLLFKNRQTYEMLKSDNEGILSIQLFGYEIDEMVQAAKILDEESKCDIIDINMGCPVKKVLKSFSGAYLLTDIDHSYKLVKSIVDNVSKPVTVKIRAGWDKNSINAIEFAKAMEKAGASAISIHGRTKADFYKGSCNLDYIKMVKDNVTIPVIGNGDIKSVDDAIYMLEYTGCDAIMIGRATIGNPWLITNIKNRLDGNAEVVASDSDKINMMIRHLNDLVELKGEKIGVLEMRGLASHYIKGFASGKNFKRAIINVKNKEEFLKVVDEYLIKGE